MDCGQRTNSSYLVEKPDPNAIKPVEGEEKAICWDKESNNYFVIGMCSGYCYAKEPSVRLCKEACPDVELVNKCLYS
jgi:hypothetical protein